MGNGRHDVGRGGIVPETGIEGRDELFSTREVEKIRNALRYVLCNRHKHAHQHDTPAITGLDSLSSARFFDGWINPDKPLEPAPARDGPVVPPRSWLLRKGWKKWGGFEAKWA